MAQRLFEYTAEFLKYPLFLITPLFMMITITKFLQPKHGKLYAVIRYVVCSVAVSMVIFIGDPINILYTVPVFFILMFISHTSAPAAKISMSLVFFSLTMSMNAMMDSTHIMNNYRNMLRFFIWMAIWLISRKCMKTNRYVLSSKMWTLVGVLAVLPFATTVAAVTLVDESYMYLSSSSTVLSVTVLPFVFVFSISLLFTVTVLAGNELVMQENRLFEIRNIYYKNLEQEQLQVRRLRHDMTNHLTAIDGLLKEHMYDRAMEYISSLKGAPGMLSMKRWCSDDVINSLLSGKFIIMDNNNIQYSVKVSLPEIPKIEPADMCSIIGNSLDNAIEASLKLDKKERNININIISQRGLFILNVINSFIPENISESFRTSKADKKSHGFGLENMRSIAGKYNGSMEIRTESSKFDLLITIPFN